MMALLKWLSKWRRLWGRPRIALCVEHVTDAPSRLDGKKIYVVGENGHQWHVVMLCPCGCRESIYLNLLPDERPRWKLSMNKDGTPSLHPSIWRTVGCRSHFFLRRGEIEWCGEEPPQ
jgi:hypothetical protein